MRRIIVTYILVMSLIAPCMSGLAAEYNSMESFVVDENIVVDEIIESEAEVIVSEEDMVLSEDEAVVSEEDTIPEENTVDTINLADETLVLAVEEVESFDDIVEISVDTGEGTVVEEIVETHQVKEAGVASAAGFSGFSTYSRTRYSGSFGAQLEGNGSKVYNALVQAFLTEKSAEEFEVTFDEPYVFEMKDKEHDENGNHLWDKDGEEYCAVTAEIKYHVQSAYDAFMQDNPRAFWVKSFKYAWGIVPVYDKEGRFVTGSISSIIITPEEKYEGAASEIYAFDSAVDAVAAEIAESLPDNADTITIIEEIHDWLCFNIVYEENAYAHTAAGVFLKDRAVVCEGYAKAFDILCEEFGIESVLISGGALTNGGSFGAHMWNYVKLNGSWYMIDATWDDQKSYIFKTYFLAGNNTRGFNDVISDERRLYTDFSGMGSGTKQFVLPILTESAYPGTWHEWKTVKVIDAEPTCAVEGRKSYHCRKCDASKTNLIDKIDKLSHIWENEYTLDAEMTCEQDEQKSYHCVDCGAINEESIIITKAQGHDWNEGSVTLEATCTSTGQYTYVCKKCESEEYDEIPSKNHIWESTYTIDVEMTCEQDEQKSYHCVDCGAINKDSIVITKTQGHDWNAGKVTIEPTCTKAGQLTYMCIKCSAEEYDEIPMAEHKWQDTYTTDQAPTCTAYGKESIYCTVCAGQKPGSLRSVNRLEPAFTAKALTMQIGQKSNVLNLTGLAGGDYIKSWTSSNKKIIKVNQKGRIAAQNQIGKAEVIITLANDTYGTTRQYRIPVTVRKKEIKTQKIAGLDKSITIQKGTTYKLQPVLKPLTSTQQLTYTSSNPDIAAVSAKGVITSKAAGKTKITVRSGDKKFVITVNVPKTVTEKIKARQKISVKSGKSVLLKVQLMPSGSDQGVQFVSKNRKVAVVDQTGKITGKKKGKAKIIVKSGTVTHICTVTVK